jgi:RimJ/RimL family protein N-acetyltransferase
MLSERLRYHPAGPANLDAFHRLVQDERFTGRGFATEMARASIARARTEPGFAEIVADVDEINAASVRVVEKLGFERIAVHQGAFGNLLLLRLVAGR